jgi:hypothetical protein
MAATVSRVSVYLVRGLLTTKRMLTIDTAGSGHKADFWNTAITTAMAGRETTIIKWSAERTAASPGHRLACNVFCVA